MQPTIHLDTIYPYHGIRLQDIVPHRATITPGHPGVPMHNNGMG